MASLRHPRTHHPGQFLEGRQRRNVRFIGRRRQCYSRRGLWVHGILREASVGGGHVENTHAGRIHQDRADRFADMGGFYVL